MIVCWEGLFASAIEEGDSTAPVSDKPTIRPSEVSSDPALSFVARHQSCEEVVVLVTVEETPDS